MKRTTAVMGVALLLLATAALAEGTWTPTQLPTVRVRDLGMPPALDGKAGDRAWSDSQRVSVKAKEFPTPGFTLSVGAFDDRLYLACETRADSAHMDARTRDDAQVLADDSFEIVLGCSAPSPYRAIRIFVTANGTVYDEALRGADATGDPAVNVPVEAAARLTGSTWTLEMSLPWSELGLAPAGRQVFGFNVLLHRAGKVAAGLSPDLETGDLMALPVGVRGYRCDSDDMGLRDLTAALDASGDLKLTVRASNERSHDGVFRIASATGTLAPPSLRGDGPMAIIAEGESATVPLAPVPVGDSTEPFLVVLAGFDGLRDTTDPITFAAYIVRHAE